MPVSLKSRIRTRTVKLTSVLCACAVALLALSASAQHPDTAFESVGTPAPVSGLVPTNHPRLPRERSLLWLAPDAGLTDPPSASRELATAMRLVDRSEHTKALSMLSQPSVQDGPLAEYAWYYAGVAERQLGRHNDARKTFREILERRPIGYLAEAAAIGEAEADEALNDHKAAVVIYDQLSQAKTIAPDDVLMRLGRAAKAAGDLQKAAEAFGRVYYEFPLSESADAAGSEFQTLPNVQPIGPDTQRYRLELGRAERLFASHQYGPARNSFERIKGSASGDERALVSLRLGECAYYLKQYRSAREAVRAFGDEGPRRAEAQYFLALIANGLGERAAYLATARRVADDFPLDRWAEEALNHLASDAIRRGDDDRADALLRELYGKFSRGPYSERAAWKIGWRAYRAQHFAETIGFFERASLDFPRSDYRPAWLYWAGRAHDQLHETPLAVERYTLETADYLNTYYGRLAVARLDGRHAASRIFADDPQSLLPPPPNERFVRALLEIGRYGDALNEVRYAQQAWGDSSALQATTAWIFQQQSQSESGTRRFNLLRGAITAMKRAYPQYLAAGGEDLPRDVLAVIFPIDFWDLIKKHSSQQGLDPYFVAAVVSQESTFVRDIRSGANAYGLMQLVPITAREYARRLNLRYSPDLLTNADANVRMGTAYLADKVKEFGGVHLALASYNAGERAVRRWLTERQGLSDREEFIDDIPYPETQNYVKKILAMTEDYRRLYSH
jgi:soluble lytic murein transglycosylase